MIQGRLFHAARIPTGDEAGVGRLGLLDPPAPLIAMALDIAGEGGALLRTPSNMPAISTTVAHRLTMRLFARILG